MARNSWFRSKALLLLLLATSLPFRIAASPPIKVDLQASFPSAPYLIELLYDPVTFYNLSSLIKLGKRQQMRKQRFTSQSSTGSPKAISIPPPQINNSTTASYNFYATMALLPTPNLFHLSNLPLP
jgi:hypothetical protein